MQLLLYIIREHPREDVFRHPLEGICFIKSKDKWCQYKILGSNPIRA